MAAAKAEVAEAAPPQAVVPLRSTIRHTRLSPKSPFQLSSKMDAWWVRHAVNATFLTLTGVVIAETATSLDLYQRLDRLTGLENRIISNGVTAASIFAWPVLWDATIGFERLVEQPRTAFGFFWPMLISSFDLRYAMEHHRGSSKNMKSLAMGLNMDAQAIISAAFAMGALLASTRSVRGTHIIMYALIACLALVIPSVSAPDGNNRAIVLAVQRASLNAAIGFIVAGIGADFLNNGASDPRYGQM